MRWQDAYFSQEPQTSWKIQTTESVGQTGAIGSMLSNSRDNRFCYIVIPVAYLSSPQSKALIVSLRYISQDIDGADFEIPRGHQEADKLRDILISAQFKRKLIFRI
jgi:hypothetical protein